MAYPSVTNTFTSGVTASATDVNQNFTDLVNGVSDGSKDINVNAVTAAAAIDANGALTVAGAVTASSTATITSGLVANSTASFASGVYMASTLQVTGGETHSGTVSFEGGIKAESTLQVTGASTFTGADTHDGHIYANSDINANSTNNPYVTSATITGFDAAALSGIVFYARGKERKCHFYIVQSGVSNTRAITLPTATASQVYFNTMRCSDGNSWTVGGAYNGGGSDQLTLYRTVSSTGNADWTSGTSHTIMGTFMYEVA